MEKVQYVNAFWNTLNPEEGAWLSKRFGVVFYAEHGVAADYETAMSNGEGARASALALREAGATVVVSLPTGAEEFDFSKLRRQIEDSLRKSCQSGIVRAAQIYF